MSGGPLAVSGDPTNPLACEVVEAILSSASELGHDAARLEVVGEDGAAIVLAVGYPHHHPTLLTRPASARRVLWYGENLPPPGGTGIVTTMYRRLPSGRLLDLAITAASLGGRRTVSGPIRRWRSRAAVEREWQANAKELLATAGRFDRIVMTSRDRVRSAEHLGLKAGFAPFGYHVSMAGPIVDPGTEDRDLGIVILGRDYDRRSRRGIEGSGVIETLRDAGGVTIVDGALYGEERTHVLQRTKVIVDVHRVPGNSSGLRFVLGAAAGAALVSERSDDAAPAVAGVHYVEAPLDRLADAARDLAADEPRRRRIVRDAQALLQGPLSMGQCLAQALGVPAND